MFLEDEGNGVQAIDRMSTQLDDTSGRGNLVSAPSLTKKNKTITNCKILQ